MKPAENKTRDPVAEGRVELRVYHLPEVTIGLVVDDTVVMFSPEEATSLGQALMLASLEALKLTCGIGETLQ
jgi:hypothetical protein